MVRVITNMRTKRITRLFDLARSKKRSKRNFAEFNRVSTPVRVILLFTLHAGHQRPGNRRARRRFRAEAVLLAVRHPHTET